VTEKKKMVKWHNIGVLGLLTVSFMVGEVAHFLMAVTSKEVANSVGFGDGECYNTDLTEEREADGRECYNTDLTEEREADGRECSAIKQKQECKDESGCMWQYSGGGWEYQVLVGPAFIVVFTISGVLMGFLADRVSRPRLLACCVMLFSLCCCLTGLATKYWQLVLLRMGIALGEAALRPAGGSLIAEMFPEGQRGVANGVFSWGVYFGYGFSFLFGIYLTEYNLLGQGWRATYVLAGLPGVLVSLTLLLVDEPRSAVEKPVPETRKLSYGTIEQMKEGGSKETTRSYVVLVGEALTQPVMVLLFLAAAVRHTAGYSWAHNNVSYFHQYHEGAEIGYWFTLCAILGGSVGVFVGGYVSDLVVTRLGLHSRLWLLSGCTIFATPFAILTLYLKPPLAFGTLLGYYFFAETWFSLLFTVLVEVVPASVRSVCIGTFLFLMNNIGGNLPMLIEPLAKMQGVGLQGALYITWPGLIAKSGVLFFLASIPLWKNSLKKKSNGRRISQGRKTSRRSSKSQKY